MKVNSNRKNRKPGPKMKQRANNRVSKCHPKRKPLKKTSLPGNIVDASNLKWRPVQLPGTLDDFGGFYGLEEIDGVDVKVVDGKVQFITKDDSKIKTSDFNDNMGDEMGFEEHGKEDSEDLIEFKNLDDIKEGELSALSSSDTEDEDMEDALSVPKSDSEEETEDQEGKLKPEVFNWQVDLDDIELPELPAWSNKMKLSFFTLQALAKLGFTSPTEIQVQSIPKALEGLDIMGKASTGSGKTLAYGIPILERLFASTNDKPIALVFTPTRELAHQVTTHLQNVLGNLVKKMPYAILSLTGGLSIQKQERLLDYEGSSRIVVATPGRFLELLEKNEDLIKRFAEIGVLVLDEADRLLQDGHFDEFEKIFKHLNREQKTLKSEKWQTMILSATFSIDLFSKLSTTHWKNLKNNKENNEMEAVLKHLMTKISFKSKPVIIDTNPESKITAQVKESLIECGPTERDLYVYYFLTLYPATTLVFCNAIDSVKKLTAYLNNLKISAFQIHSSMLQKNRLKSLEKFQQLCEVNAQHGKPTVLIASDVAARGLDIPGIKHVIHYHLPRSADIYIHRSGRTARGNQEGVAVTICSPQEAIGPLRKLRKLLANDLASKTGKKWQKELTVIPIEDDILTQLRERSRLASALADDELATKSLNKDDIWLKKAADDLGIDIESDEEKDVILSKNKNKKKNKQMAKSEAKSMRYQLADLLQIPIRKDLRRSYLTGGLVNLADNLVKNKGHNNIVGHEKVDALELLKKKKSKK
ncbi:ATP-dependent RNA helicase Ecym_5326 [Eremothecium cymbalariae DBVPG|uniref:RNA helicase n=1 Tax=Eremothecium cymbalariae (strain CBS 270.75 / DBVPG 7215 / KCTC 17166 / NRRL Y-17582) TaxID=931890 RepID=I6NDE3_ERECY|nr:hypothetical protein Ecym_5326 [Eremothecium cymbalariae DBVPG\